MDPTLTVLLFSSLAAFAAALGVVPLLVRERPPVAWIGWANALAAGLMMGAAYVLMAAGLTFEVLWGATGAGIGVTFVYGAHTASGTKNLDRLQLREENPLYGYQLLLVNTLHSAPEGVAIGAASAVNPSFGVYMAVAIAVHNIPEGTVLSRVLTSRGVGFSQAAGLSVTTNVSQVLLAVATFAIVSAAPGLLPWALGFAVGGLIYLVMAELLPECYEQAGHTSIALVTIVAMGMVILLSGMSGA